ncbi:PepSY domain-containing protein [Staphylococcus massiliensis]|uniref:Peptidase propeptide and ypeb domain protein n=1 Tax=Staphylococcus massiliensis S46 TaxID=1229783 RepID=K9ASN0_9STAP|nr:PepSY domain-containing protein [Staphylococcus massiliensis]EKU50373.1 Peptidase propeptide and ypeb domain protein [Staphylococcus massiliensis S46]PNZ97873.1 peptidase [Staphylococcus massiliensis CCUG 55927]
MKHFLKIMLVLMILGLGIALATVMYQSSKTKMISQKEAENIVQERYGGKIVNVEEREHKSKFEIAVVNKDTEITVQIDRKTKDIDNVKSKKLKQKDKDKSSKKDKKKKAKKLKISKEKAKSIAKKKVGGYTSQIKLNQSKHYPYYEVRQEVNQNEGAILTINAVTGKVHNVSWFKKGQTQNEASTDDDDQYEAQDDDQASQPAQYNPAPQQQVQQQRQTQVQLPAPRQSAPQQHYQQLPRQTYQQSDDDGDDDDDGYEVDDD